MSGEAAADRRPRRSRDSATGDDGGNQEPQRGASDEFAASGITRRRLLTIGGILAAGGGWYFVFRDDSVGPKEVLEQNRIAWNDGDAASYRETYHSESPVRDESGWGEEQFPPDGGIAWELEESEILTESDSEVTVREVTIGTDPDTDERIRHTSTVTLRKEDGEWKIWGWETEEFEEIDGNGE